MKFFCICSALALCCANLFAGFAIHNEDCTQYFVEFNYEATEAGARKWIDNYLVAGSDNLKVIMLNAQGQVASYDSKVLTPCWTVFDRDEDGILSYKGKKLPERTSKMYDRMRTFAEAGLDVWKIWIDEIRSHGISPWMSIRMNDVHGADDDDSYSCCKLWKEHPEYRLAPYRGKDWFSRELDYAQPAVRKLYMDVIAEQLERYDCDGIELDFMRFGRVFRYGHEIESAHFMTEFVREVRNRCNAKAEAVGHKVGVAVRVPAAPEDAYGFGFDVETWLDEGLVDIVTPAPFFNTNWDDVPVQAWKKLVRGRAILAVGLDTANRPSPGFPEPMWGGSYGYALANLFYSRGADAIYCFNHFGPSGGKYYQIVGNPDVLEKQCRRTLLTFNDTRRLGIRMGALLPVDLGAGFVDFRMNIGTLPQQGRAVQLLLASRTRFPQGTCPDVWLNCVKLKPVENPMVTLPASLVQVQAYEVPFGTLTTEGNVIDMRYAAGGTVKVEWIELVIGGWH